MSGTARIPSALLVALLSTAALQAHAAERVMVLGIDGIDPDVIELLVKEGKLPTFARLRKEGAFGRLKSSEPILSPIIWTTIATGKPPSEHGIGDFTAINEKTGEKLPVTSQMRKVRALWNILTSAGRSVAVVGWWATWPAESVNGVLVSDHTCYHFLFEDGATGGGESLAVIHPPTRSEEIRALVRRPGDVRPEDIATFVRVSADEFARPFDFQDDLSHFKWAWATAESYRRIGLELWKKDHPDLLMVYVEGVDSTSHLFGHLFRATGLGGELAEQQKRFGQAVEQMYVYADRLVGEYLAALGKDDTLAVLSDHGFELGALPTDPSKMRDMRRVSAHNHRIEGVLYLYGKDVKPGSTIKGATLVDVAPTILALEGLAPAKDMPGRVLVEALDMADPERTLATYESAGDPSVAQTGATDAAVDPAILSRLEALGYLDTESERGDRNLAAIAFEEGRYDDALAEYRKQLASNPDDAGLHASLAGVLGSLERYDEALEHLGEAVRLNPLYGGAYHNRAVIHERRGRREDAIAEYRKAVRYGSGYQPSRDALRRLKAGGSDEDLSDAEKQAAAMAREASLLARKGRYDEAMKLLDEAEQTAPRYVLVQQYRSNVAFLMGDKEAAIVALEKALEIEPDNPLFKANLERLQKGTALPSPTVGK